MYARCEMGCGWLECTKTFKRVSGVGNHLGEVLVLRKLLVFLKGLYHLDLKAFIKRNKLKHKYTSALRLGCVKAYTYDDSVFLYQL